MLALSLGPGVLMGVATASCSSRSPAAAGRRSSACSSTRSMMLLYMGIGTATSTVVCISTRRESSHGGATNKIVYALANRTRSMRAAVADFRRAGESAPPLTGSTRCSRCLAAARRRAITTPASMLNRMMTTNAPATTAPMTGFVTVRYCNNRGRKRRVRAYAAGRTTGVASAQATTAVWVAPMAVCVLLSDRATAAPARPPLTP